MILPGMSGERFQSTPPMQGATQRLLQARATLTFQSTPPMQGATHFRQSSDACCDCFNPRPLCRERHLFQHFRDSRQIVSIHAPYAGSDTADATALAFTTVSIHAPYAGSDEKYPIYIGDLKVSIHAPYAGSDAPALSLFPGTVVSIHAPYAGSDGPRSSMALDTGSFNPRPLCRERLSAQEAMDYIVSGFNPRPLCRERPVCGGLVPGDPSFNPRPLCRERLRLA